MKPSQIRFIVKAFDHFTSTQIALRTNAELASTLKQIIKTEIAAAELSDFATMC